MNHLELYTYTQNHGLERIKQFAQLEIIIKGAALLDLMFMAALTGIKGNLNWNS